MAKRTPKTKSDKHAGGRPSKYQGAETIRKVYAAAELLDNKPELFLSACTEDQLGLAIGVNGRGTVLEWAKQYPEFSDALKRWTASRNSALMKLAKVLPPAIWIFMTKNMMGWKDAKDVNLGNAPDASGSLPALLIKVIHTKDGDSGNGNGDGHGA